MHVIASNVARAVGVGAPSVETTISSAFLATFYRLGAAASAGRRAQARLLAEEEGNVTTTTAAAAAPPPPPPPPQRCVPCTLAVETALASGLCAQLRPGNCSDVTVSCLSQLASGQSPAVFPTLPSAGLTAAAGADSCTAVLSAVFPVANATYQATLTTQLLTTKVTAIGGNYGTAAAPAAQDIVVSSDLKTVVKNAGATSSSSSSVLVSSSMVALVVATTLGLPADQVAVLTDGGESVWTDSGGGSSLQGAAVAPPPPPAYSCASGPKLGRLCGADAVGAITGIIAGGLVAVALLVVLVALSYRNRRRALRYEAPSVLLPERPNPLHGAYDGAVLQPMPYTDGGGGGGSAGGAGAAMAPPAQAAPRVAPWRDVMGPAVPPRTAGNHGGFAGGLDPAMPGGVGLPTLHENGFGSGAGLMMPPPGAVRPYSSSPLMLAPPPISTAAAMVYGTGPYPGLLTEHPAGFAPRRGPYVVRPISAADGGGPGVYSVAGPGGYVVMPLRPGGGGPGGGNMFVVGPSGAAVGRSRSLGSYGMASALRPYGTAEAAEPDVYGVGHGSSSRWPYSLRRAGTAGGAVQGVYAVPGPEEFLGAVGGGYRGGGTHGVAPLGAAGAGSKYGGVRHTVAPTGAVGGGGGGGGGFGQPDPSMYRRTATWNQYGQSFGPL
ncbi:hypothetical protein PLESTM_001380000 [Pleodorina starrii]|nr:hypothetical protein PLESTM_001380000 [Pleodorina starrii]